jgi:hypothetical protein
MQKKIGVIFWNLVKMSMFKVVQRWRTTYIPKDILHVRGHGSDGWLVCEFQSKSSANRQKFSSNLLAIFLHCQLGVYANGTFFNSSDLFRTCLNNGVYSQLVCIDRSFFPFSTALCISGFCAISIFTMCSPYIHIGPIALIHEKDKRGEREDRDSIMLLLRPTST